MEGETALSLQDWEFPLTLAEEWIPPCELQATVYQSSFPMLKPRPPSNTPASAHSHSRVMWSPDGVSLNWDKDVVSGDTTCTENRLFPLAECCGDVPSGEQRCGGRLRRWRLGALGGWVRLWAGEASLGGAAALWRGVSSLPLPGSAEQEACQRTEICSQRLCQKCLRLLLKGCVN